MCGINGIYAYSASAPPVDAAELVRTRDHMSARGPDADGSWLSADGRVGLGHRRLAIIDLSPGGAQPMATPDGTLIVTFNGEIYNYLELRAALEAKGRVFRSRSDTEVLLQLYAEEGPQMVRRLRGMFAFAIWDAAKRSLFLARDPYGIKPLYYADGDGTFRFASQVRSLVAGGAVRNDVSSAGLVGFLLLGSVPDPVTILRDVVALPAGHTMVVDASGARALARYHSIAGVYREAERSARRYDPVARSAAAADALLDSVRGHLVSDVPVGAFLSAGIDSSALVGLMRDAGQSDIETVTLSFEEFRGGPDDEASLAAEVAARYGTRHTERVVTPAEFESDLPRILAAMDQPSIDGINTWFVSKAAAELGLKVAVSGVGGDELFGGYPSFRDVPRWVGWTALPAAVPMAGLAARKAFLKLQAYWPTMSPKLPGIVEYGGDYAGAWFLRRGLFMPWELSSVLEPEIVREGLEHLDPRSLVHRALDPMPATPFARVATMEASLYMRNQLLRDTDWASMAHSLEVRTPLADATLLDRIACLGAPDPSLPAKHELVTAPRLPVPQAVAARRKSGFAVPVSAWIKPRGSRPPGGRTAGYGYARDLSRRILAHRFPDVLLRGVA